MKKFRSLLAVVLSTLFLLSGCSSELPEQSITTQEPTQVESLQTTQEPEEQIEKKQESEIRTEETQKPEIIEKPIQATAPKFDLSSIPEYSGKPYVATNGNVPYFTQSDYITAPFEIFSPLDSLGRCGVAYANICIDIMPKEDRGSIGSVKPSGWHTIKYENVEGKYLYNRCHLIGFQLSGENANDDKFKEENKMKKIMLFLMAVLMTVNLVGCGGGDVQEAKETNELVVAVFDRGNVPEGEGPVDNNRWTQHINDTFGKENNIKVKFYSIPRLQEAEKLNVLMASKDAPDICFTYQS